MFKTRWGNFGNNLGIYISTTRPSLEHWAKNVFKKFTPKHVQNTFGQFGNDFGRFLNFENYFKNISKTRPSMEHWAKKISRKNYPKTCSKRLDSFGTRFLGTIRPSLEHRAKKFLKKITPRHVQNTFGQIWERFWAFLEFWKFLDFLKTFRRLDPPSNTGQKTFLEKFTQNMLKTRLDTILGFTQFWKFLIY